MYRKKGFTLIEFMIVVAIIAIITAVAYPMYKKSFGGLVPRDGEKIISLAAVLQNEKSEM